MAKNSVWTTLSRIWLVIVNILFFGISLLSFVLASGILSLSNQSLNTVLKGSFVEGFDIRSIAYALIVLGFFFAATAITGCCGGICRLSQFLTFYIACVVLNTILLAFAGFYALFKAVERKNSWAAMTVNNWNSLGDTTKDFVQQAFRCCGFTKGDSYAYKGNSTNFWHASVTPSNACAFSNTLNGCHDAGNAIYSHFVNVIAIATVLGLMTCILSAIAANAARKRRALVESGFLRTSKASSSYEKTPLL